MNRRPIATVRDEAKASLHHIADTDLHERKVSIRAVTEGSLPVKATVSRVRDVLNRRVERDVRRKEDSSSA